MAVTWVGGTSLVEATGTSLAANAPAGLANGDLLLAGIYARSAITPPSGWTLVAQTGNFTDGSVTQNLAVYRKNSTTSGDSSASFTWAQASSHPIGIVYAAARGTDSSPTAATRIDNSLDLGNTAGLVVTGPDITATADGQMMVAFASVTVPDPNGGPYSLPGAPWSSVSTNPAGRLICVRAARNTGQAGPVTFQLDNYGWEGPGLYGNGSVVVLADEGTPAVDVRISADGPLDAAPMLLGNIPATAIISDDGGPLGSPSAIAWHDNSGGINSEGSSLYTVDLVTPGADVRVPISSWQATLQTGAAQYVQCVVPACGYYVDDIGAATSFRISRKLTMIDGTSLDYQICEAPVQSVQFAQGSTNHSATISGYIDAPAAVTWPAISARALQDVRTVFSYTSGLRVRCAIDWLLQPGMSASYGGTTFTVAYMQYFVNQTDAYMDVGQRLE